MRELIGYRFFFTLFTACFVCISIAMPNSGEQQFAQQLAYDFKLPDSAAAEAQHISIMEAPNTMEAPLAAEALLASRAPGVMGIKVGSDGVSGADGTPSLDGADSADSSDGAYGVDGADSVVGAERYLPSPYGRSEIGGGDVVHLKYNNAGVSSDAGIGANAGADAGTDASTDASTDKSMDVSAGAGADSDVGSDVFMARANGGVGYVVLDAGHGGLDPGSTASGQLEKDIALEVALLAAALLREAGIETVLTRESDETVPIERRIERAGAGARAGTGAGTGAVTSTDAAFVGVDSAAAAGADSTAATGADSAAAFIISVHCDWYKNKSINGTSTLYNEGDGQSKALAELIQSYITQDLGTIDRGVHPHNDIILLHEAQVPTVIVELAFLSNKHDLALIATDQFKSQAAQNLADGISSALLHATAEHAATVY
ncbi:MAG: N-acetylmuramoyl-L-alanine amidase [Oscillospiraceae bacterium]|nr:N-acetylmuramoyl-L-alanine amidase [Oscillospiraceae bacterium]